MRIIKFRAWDDKTKKWLHAYESLGGCDILGETIVLGEWMGGISLTDYGNIVVEQFTGLKDKTGKEIYEGDIVKLYNDPTLVGAIEFFYGAWQIQNGEKAGGQLGSIDSASEIIGNIHETPDLLKP